MCYKPLNYTELMNSDLTGYAFAIGRNEMTRSSRSEVVDYRYYVIQDTGTECVVAPYGNTRDTVMTHSKKWVVERLANCPLLEWNEADRIYTNLIVNPNA